MFFDSHAHLEDEKFNEDRFQVIEALPSNGVSYYINAGSDVKTSRASIGFAEQYPYVYAVCGVHPHETENMTENDFDEIKNMLTHPKCVGLGEIGLDYYYDTAFKDKQRYWLNRQLEYAAKNDIPVVIHDRDAHEECFEAVKAHGVRGVFHCYSGSAEMAKELIKIGFYLSFNGVLTFKNARKSVEVVEQIPLDRIMIETDCPYLAPEPFRGTRNEPKNVSLVAERIAAIKNITVDDVARITTENTARLYGLNL